MFPLQPFSVQLILALLSLGLGALVYGFADDTRIRRRLLLRLPILILGLLLFSFLDWPWNAYAGWAAATTAAVYLSAFALGIAWGWLVHRLANWLMGSRSRVAKPAFALAPAIAAAGLVLESQRIPDAPCAERLPLMMGSLDLTVPRDLQLSIRTGPYDQIYRYAVGADEKYDVVSLCDQSRNGTEPIEATGVSIVWPVRLHDYLDRACVDGEILSRFRSECRLIGGATIDSMHLDLAKGVADYDTYWLGVDEPGLRSEGTPENGHYCRDSGYWGDRDCVLWRTVAPGVIARARSGYSAFRDERRLKGLGAAIELVLAALTWRPVK